MRWLTSHYKDVKVPCFYVNKIFMKDFAEINFLWAVNITFVLPQNMNVLCVCNAWVCWVKNWTSSFECEVQSRNKLVLSDAPWSAENMPIIGQQKISLVNRKYAWSAENMPQKELIAVGSTPTHFFGTNEAQSQIFFLKLFTFSFKTHIFAPHTCVPLDFRNIIPYLFQAST